MKLKSTVLIILAHVILTASVSLLHSQSRLLQRNSSAIPVSYLQNLQTESRKLINLNGQWNISSPDEKVDPVVQVPFCYDFRGRMNCSRSFGIEFDNPDSYNFLLFCDGVNYQCEITINGRFVVKHEGGFTQFSSIIPPGTIKQSDNTIEVKVDNRLDHSRTLPVKGIGNLPKNYGGIYRDIYIIAVPKSYIKNVSCSSEIDINFSADLKNTITISATDLSAIRGNDDKKQFTVKTEILDSAGIVKGSSPESPFIIADNSTVQAENKFNLSNPIFWSPDNPYVYTLRVTISFGQSVIDVYKCDYGFYELSEKTNLFIMNRNEIKFKGVNYVEEFPLCGISTNYSELEKDVKNIKSLGCNVIKVLGRPASPYLINLCNRYGLLIFEELPVYDVPPGILSSEYFISLAENQLTEMVQTHRNNPCIVAYGLGNDLDVTSEKTHTYMSKLSDMCKKLDTRIRYYSTKIVENDICRDLVDMTGINFYDSDLKLLKDIVSDSKIKKEKIFVSNYGKVINPSNNSGYSDPTSIESQSKYIVDFYKIAKNSFLLGSFFQSYADWNSDSPNLKGFDNENRFIKTTGLFSFFREMRSSATILRKNFNEEDLPNLNIGTYSRQAPILFVFIGIIFFIIFIYLTNSVRRFRENVSRALFRPFIFYSDVREQHLIGPFQNLLLAVILAVGNGLFFANILYFWKDSMSFDMMLSLFLSSDEAKILADGLILNPLKLTLILSAIVFVKIFLISVVVWLFSLTIKYRIGFNNIYTITVWGFLPTILLLVAGTFYIRALYENPDFVIIGLSVAAFLYLLTYYRILKGTYIIFDTFFLKSYTYGVATLILVLGTLYYYMNSSRNITDYFYLVISFLKNS